LDLILQVRLEFVNEYQKYLLGQECYFVAVGHAIFEERNAEVRLDQMDEPFAVADIFPHAIHDLAKQLQAQYLIPQRKRIDSGGRREKAGGGCGVVVNARQCLGGELA